MTIRTPEQELAHAQQELARIAEQRKMYGTATAATEEVITTADDAEISDEQQAEFDEQIKSRAVALLEQKLTDDEVTKTLTDEYEGLDEEFLTEVLTFAHERIIDAQDEERKQLSQLLGQVADERNAAQLEADKHLVEKYVLAGRLDKSIDPNDKERAAKIIRTHEEQEQREENFTDSPEVFPACPIFPGALTELAQAMYPSLPLEFKQWGLIVRWGLLRSGLDLLENEPHLQPRFYTVLVSLPNRGKTACINESRDALRAITRKASHEIGAKNSITPTSRVFASVENLSSADSGQFLVQAFFDAAKETDKQYQASICSDNRAKILLDPDELSDVFMKAQVTNGRNSTIFSEMLKLHSGNRTGNGTIRDGSKEVENAHLAVLAGTTVEKYPLLWTGTGGGGDGLISRFIAITTNNPQVPPVPATSDFAAVGTLYGKLAKLAISRPRTIRLSPDAAQVLDTWWKSFDNSKKSATRILETVKQIVIVLAVTNLSEDDDNDVVVVSGELMRQATKFGAYEIAIRERINPSDAWSVVQAMENKIIEWTKKHASRVLPKSRNDIRRGVHPHRLPGGLTAFNNAWDACVKSGVLKPRSANPARFSL
jgi:hypothetical protein